MSSSESKSAPSTPQNVNKSRSSTSTIPTDLTVSSTDSSDRQLVIHNRRLQQQIALSEIETRKRDTLIDKLRNEYEEKIRVVQREKDEAISAKSLAENNVELRLALQSKEMSKIQSAINTQLSEVITRQKHLENVNQKLRERADIAKNRLDTFSYDEERYSSLAKLNLSDLSLYEYAELMIYRNVLPEKKKVSEAELKLSQFESKISKLSELLAKSDVYMEKIKIENENLLQEMLKKEKDIEDIKKSVQQMDTLNAILQEKLSQHENVEVNLRVETDKRESELAAYRNKNEQLVRNLQNSTSENNLLVEQLNQINREFQNVRFTCELLGQKSDSGFSRLTSLTQSMQKKQLELLEQFSTNVRQNKIDDKYREQYLDTIKQLVAEQVRTQQYITRIICERDQFGKEVTELQMKVKNAQMDLVEEEIKRNKETEKVEYLENKINQLQLKLKFKTSEPRPHDQINIKETKEYQMVLKDLELLLQHRTEITDMKKFVQKLQEKY